MVKQHFDHVDVWVFDLDNTLYPPGTRLFDQIEQRMTEFVMKALGVDRAKADHLREHYWRRHGTTLAGLMREHDLDPEEYLTAVHDISFAALRPDPALRARIAGLPGRKIVYTNGSAPYAHRVLEARGLQGVMDAIYGVEHAGYRPKPEAEAFAAVFAAAQVNPARAAIFEDEPRNLTAPFEMGMRTVHVAPERLAAPHIHHHTQELGAFLSRLM